ncbi:carboxymuconolactone decarboxylase family protein [Viridibacillus sp. YIM B01967]|uniref:Carboxymuconolactone decarboxylase family protein n=1 Tax=Viridibacillus soli TaxID=2798301 RepID=A0ABS1H7U3_9BACL|nr:carboxymuconolactone decarboxylase family protein [Viridibacillus soli]MBK3495093.1 carboxymuconolactone decarboxylase family protein [Viridibacillus soli]
MNPENLKAGFKAREEVLGKENVEKFIENTNEFNQPFHELAMEYCWGDIWNRPGLDRRTRSLVNLGILTALNYQNELSIHLSGAIRNGCTKEEIQEVLLQCSIYCGVPAAGTSIATANAFFQELEKEQQRGD